MNQDISIRPAHLGDIDDQGFSENSFTQPARISMDNGFSVIDEGGVPVIPPAVFLQIIMLAENDVRIYYPKDSYDPKSPMPPTCFSDNGITPSVGAMQPQWDLCATCPRAVWDQESPNGSYVPACDNRYKVACLVAGARGRTFLLSVPPASRRPYEQYKKFLRTHHANPKIVITRLDWKDRKLGFSFEGWIDDAAAALVRQVSATDEPALIVNSMDKPRTLALPAPAAQPTPPAPAAQPAPPALTAKGLWEAVDDLVDPLRPPKRRGRPPKESGFVPAGPVPAAPAANFTPPQSYPAQTSSGFGMEPGKRPPVDIQEALSRAGF
jgi:hypothetical protein